MSVASTVHATIEAFNTHDVEHAYTSYAEQVVIHDPFAPVPQHGLASIRKADADSFRAFPDVQLELEHLVADSHSAAFQARMRGTHLGPLGAGAGAIPPTAQHFEIDVAVFVRVEDDRIVEEHRYYDTASLMAQLGLMEG